MKTSTNSNLIHKLFCLILLILSLLVTYYFVNSDKAFSNDTGLTFLDIITSKKLILHHPLFRYSNYIIQFPTYLMANFFPIVSDSRFEIAKMVFAYSYGLFPLMFLFFFLQKYYKNPNNSFYLFPIFSFFYLYTITDVFAFNFSSETVMWSWVAAYILQRDKFTSVDSIKFILASIMVFVAYEPGVLVLIFLYYTHHQKFEDQYKLYRHSSVSLILLVMIAIQSFNILKLYFCQFEAQTKSFVSSLLSSTDPLLLLYSIPFILILLSFFTKKRYQQVIFYILLAISLYVLLTNIETYQQVNGAYHLRIWTVPLVFLLLILNGVFNLKLNKVFVLVFACYFTYSSINTSKSVKKRWELINSIDSELVTEIKNYPKIVDRLLSHNYLAWAASAEGIINGGTLKPTKFFIHEKITPQGFCHKSAVYEHNWMIKRTFEAYGPDFFDYSKLLKSY
jgi:hypothetical protein